MKPGAASLPSVIILASGFLLLSAIALVAANSDAILGEHPPSPQQQETECPEHPPFPNETASPTAGCDQSPAT